MSKQSSQIELKEKPTHQKLYQQNQIDRVLGQPWWTLRDTGIYLNRSYGAVRSWASKVALKRCNNDHRLTCKAWVDSALLGKQNKKKGNE